MKILIVDDNVTSRHVLRVQLEAGAHQTHEAQDGEEALALLKRVPVDAVISDLLMPTMDGFRFCIELRKHPRLSPCQAFRFGALGRIQRSLGDP